MSSQESTGYEKRRAKRTPRAVRNILDAKIRCQCDTQNEVGEMIECEQCKEWQHTVCMGIISAEDTRDYRCEICDPRLLLVSKSEAIRYQKTSDDGETSSNVAATIPKSQPKRRRSGQGYELDFEKFANYLAKESEKLDRPVIAAHFFTKYKEISGYEGAPTTLIAKCRQKLLSETHIMSQFGMDTRAKMLFVTSISVDDDLLKEMRKTATVSVDPYQRITSYTSRNIAFAGKHSMQGIKSGRKRARINRRDEELEEMDVEMIDDSGSMEVVPYEQDHPVIPDSFVNRNPFQGQGLELAQIPNIGAPFMRNLKHEVAMIFPQPSVNPPFNNNNMNMNMPSETVMAGNLLNGMSQFLVSMTRLIESQNRMITGGQGSSSLAIAVGEEISQRAFLEYILVYIRSVDSVQLSQLIHQINIKMQGITTQNDKIPVKRLQVALESLLALTDTSTEIEVDNLTNAANFFKSLHIYASAQPGQQLGNVCDNLKRKMEAAGEYEMISIEKLKKGLELAIQIIST